MGRFIYSIKDIFSTDSQNGCLGQHNCVGFLIESYQRGYKWDSEEDNWESPTPVNTLFRDIFDAIHKNRNSQYYLQFINVKEQTAEDGQRYLEVIDGQQRLTTLSILSATLKHKLGCNNDFAGKLIRYRCRKENESTLDSFHDNPVKPDPKQEENDQTNWFFKKAYCALSSIIEQLETRGCNPRDFYNYLTENVLVIVNVVRETVRSEDIFNNLNSRKVFLTNVDLIKGLLLCKAVRNEAMPYRELLERRTLCGRQWDEMTRWLNAPSVGAFFFESTQRACYDFILLAVVDQYKDEFQDDSKLNALYSAAEEDFQPDIKRYKLFNFIYSKIRNSAEAMVFFHRLCDIYWCLHDIYDDIPRHNEVGFILFSKKNSVRIKTLKTIIQNNGNNTALLMAIFDDPLKDDIADFIESYPYSYRNNPQNLRRDLMFINCFKVTDGIFTPIDTCPFPFHLVDHGAPDNNGRMNSLEHIFPQNPLTNPDKYPEKEPCECFDEYTTIKYAEQIEDLSKGFSPEDETLAVAKKYEENWFLGKIKDFYDNLTEHRDIQENEIRKNLHRFYAGLTQDHKNLFEQQYKNGYTYLDSIGNVVLLLGGENATVSNFNFAKKRSLIREMINSGKPIPAHTFDAFSKIGGDMNHTECWQLSDVVNNEKFTLGQVFQLRHAMVKKSANLAVITAQS